MYIRPTDASGDILPFLSSSGLLFGPEAVAQLVKYRLSLLQGEWWENESLGFPLPESLRSGRPTAADAATLSSQITAYVRETDGVQDVENVRFSMEGRPFSYACEIRTKVGNAEVNYSAEL